MKKNGKILLILASVLTIVGFLGFMLIMTIRGWDFSTLSTEDFETNTYNVSEKFDKISIIKVGAEEFVPAKYTVVDSEYVIEECLKAQTSYMLVCE